jgi:pilus assembly protein CpaF
VTLQDRIERSNSRDGGRDEGEARPTRTFQIENSQSASRETGTYQLLKSRIQRKLMDRLDPGTHAPDDAEIHKQIEEVMTSILREENVVLSASQRSELLAYLTAEILGLGPIQPLMQDPTITEVMVNGPDKIYIERKGKIYRTKLTFDSNQHLMQIIDRIISPLGRRIDESSPYVDARLPDGSRVNAVIPPISMIGPILTVRKFAQDSITDEKLLELGTITPQALEFLRACVRAKVNMIISGGTSTGKTTLLNVISQYIPRDERIVTIEDSAELQLRQEHVLPLEKRPPNVEGRGEVTIRDLVVNSLRMRPDRIIVGEIRDEAALDMLQAMNTGHEGSMSTLHSNSPRDTLARIETMTLMAGMDLPSRAIREQISSAIHLIIHLDRLLDGSRRIIFISEVQGITEGEIVLEDIFRFKQSGIHNGKVVGRLLPTGNLPSFMARFEAFGIRLPASIFGVRRQKAPKPPAPARRAV